MYPFAVQCFVSSCDGLAGHMIPPHNTLAVQKPPMGSSKPARVPGLPDPPTHRESELVCVGLYAMLNAGWPAMLAALSFLLIINLFDALFGGILGALQTLARAPGVPRYPLHVTRPSLQLAKTALPPRVISALDDPPQPPRGAAFTRLARDPMFGLAGGGVASRSRGGAGLSPRNLACIYTVNMFRE